MRSNWMFLLWIGITCAGDVHEKYTYECSELVDGVPLTYRAQSEDGGVTEHYQVADLTVDQAAFEQRLHQAHDAYVRTFADVRARLIPPAVRVRFALKIITLLHDALVQLMAQLDDAHVRQFLAFKPETIDTTQSLERVRQQLIPALDFVNEPNAEHESLATLITLSEHVRQVYDRVAQLYADSLEAVLAQSDDPKLLRQLLETINH